jgi:hypothetical protein
MTTRTAARNVYDPRVRELVRATGDPDLFPELGIPRSTAAGWLRGAFKPAVGTQAVSKSEVELHARLAKLERRIQVLVAVLRLLVALVRVSDCRLNGERLPTDRAKADILRGVGAARKTLRLESAVRVQGLSLSRYHAWTRAERACDLTDRSSCPRTFPGQLTTQETATVHEMVTADEYRHVPTSMLAVLAQRLGRVCASASAASVVVLEHPRHGGSRAAARGVLRAGAQRSLATQRPERTDPGRGVLRAGRAHPHQASGRQERGPKGTPRSEPHAVVRGVRGARTSWERAGQRRVIRRAKPKMQKKARLSN